jgi:hypothetical protein
MATRINRKTSNLKNIFKTFSSQVELDTMPISEIIQEVSAKKSSVDRVDK